MRIGTVNTDPPPPSRPRTKPTTSARIPPTTVMRLAFARFDLFYGAVWNVKVIVPTMGFPATSLAPETVTV
jgi:hypothetical protein